MSKVRRGNKKATSENALQKSAVTSEHVADPKNDELRWQQHYNAARKAIAAEDLQGAVLELQSCVKFGERLGDYRLANSFTELGFVALKLNEFESARSLIRMALGVRKTIYGATHPSVAIEYNNLAMTYEWNQDYANAKPHLLKAVSILEEHANFDTVNQAEPFEGLAAVYLAHYEFRKAEQACMKAIQIRDELLGRLHPLSMKTIQLLVQIHRANGNAEGVASARDVYSKRLHEYANSQTAGATAKALRKVLESEELTAENDKFESSIGEFLKLMARR